QVGYIIDYPVDISDVSGRTTFVITDCIFVDGNAVAKYLVSFVPNTTLFELQFSVPIPMSTPMGARPFHQRRSGDGDVRNARVNMAAGLLH
ncbi:MAG TPA: hypothetical protein VJ622_00640, partial [Acidimicrobiia bacterium]|nr:hypothetical protein [Acidimicrobiia bacterium]